MSKKDDKDQMIQAMRRQLQESYREIAQLREQAKTPPGSTSVSTKEIRTMADFIDVFGAPENDRVLKEKVTRFGLIPGGKPGDIMTAAGLINPGEETLPVQDQNGDDVARDASSDDTYWAKANGPARQ